MFTRQLPPFNSMVGSVLIAMPEMEDKRFYHAVVYITHHTQTDGARGIVINQPTNKITCQDILKQLKTPYQEEVQFPPILVGGPDHKIQGFILHTPDTHYGETQDITPDVCLTATQEILEDIAISHSPQKYLVAVGCATWAPGQMEEEIMGNIWLNAPATNEILFDTPYADRWNKAMELIGFTPDCFSPRAGKA